MDGEGLKVSDRGLAASCLRVMGFRVAPGSICPAPEMIKPGGVRKRMKCLRMVLELEHPTPDQPENIVTKPCAPWPCEEQSRTWAVGLI